MKLIRVLSSIALVSCLGANSGVALAKATEEVSNLTSLSQTEPRLIANFWKTLGQTTQTVEQVTQVVNSVNSMVEQENRRQELEAARAAAREQERLEAERRQQYFESLSPEEQQVYIKEQQAMQAQRDQAAIMLMQMMFGGSGSTQQGDGRNYTCSAGTDPNGGDQLYTVYVPAGETPPSSSCM